MIEHLICAAKVLRYRVHLVREVLPVEVQPRIAKNGGGCRGRDRRGAVQNAIDQALSSVNDPGIRRRGIVTASDCIQKSCAATSCTVGLSGQETFEGSVRIAGLREVQSDWTANSPPTAPHSFRIDGDVHGNIE